MGDNMAEQTLDNLFDTTYSVLEPHSTYLHLGAGDYARHYFDHVVVESLTWVALNVVVPILAGVSGYAVAGRIQKASDVYEQATSGVNDELRELKGDVRQIKEALNTLDKGDAPSPPRILVAQANLAEVLKGSGMPASIAREDAAKIVVAACKELYNLTINIKELNMGDKFENITNSTIVNRSVVEGSFNKVKEDFGQETAEALLRVAEEINKSGNVAAGAMFKNFNEELQKATPQKSALRQYWDGIVAVLPVITQIPKVAELVSKLFS